MYLLSQPQNVLTEGSLLHTVYTCESDRLGSETNRRIYWMMLVRELRRR